CGFPVMAMMRLSCKASGGKANLHQGAVGVGIDIKTGAAVNAIQNGANIKVHPDTQQELSALQVPAWQELLELACGCYDMTGLGYLGVDLVLDRDLGPLLLELNARPGLSIQIANKAGLLPRLQAVEQLKKIERYSNLERVAFAREHFAAL
ncbi:MAG TPA: sugar-transfer associated ATP-grasp domain-containing protein, partial [Cellvibrionaceae bacterium]|nr:sugar-transfer associated ATP-grasp domain-containing protein [Cellvibrionaceae bacterium]